MDLQKIKADIELAREVSPSGWMLDLPTLDSMVQLIERQEAELRQNVQALSDSNLALMEQTELSQKAVRDISDLYECQRRDGNEIARLMKIAQAANRQAEAPVDLSALHRYDLSGDGACFAPNDGSYVLYDDLVALLAAPQQHAQAALSDVEIMATYNVNGCSVVKTVRAILATRQPAPAVSQQAGSVAKPYGWIVKMNDGHETYFREEPTGFRSESWKGLAEVIDLYAAHPPADAAPVDAKPAGWVAFYATEDDEIFKVSKLMFAERDAQICAGIWENQRHKGNTIKVGIMPLYAAKTCTAQGEALSQEAGEDLQDRFGLLLAQCIEQVDGCMDETQVEPEDAAAWQIVRKHFLAQRAASQLDSERDAARLDYVLKNGAFIVAVGVTHKSRYQLWNQDEDENHTVLSGPGDYATRREAIDAAMAAQQGEKA